MPDPTFFVFRAELLLRPLIAAVAACGLTMHNDFYAGVCRRDYWAYYTNQSNLAVFLYFTLGFPLLRAGNHSTLVARAEFALMMSIMLTFCVFHLMIYPGVRQVAASAPRTRENRMIIAANILQHYTVPLLTLLYWLVCSQGKEALRPADALLWLLFPSAYLLYILMRARVRGPISGTDSAYPYPFLDIARIGYRRTAVCCIAVVSLSIAAGLALILTMRLVFSVIR